MLCLIVFAVLRCWSSRGHGHFSGKPRPSTNAVCPAGQHATQPTAPRRRVDVLSRSSQPAADRSMAFGYGEDAPRLYIRLVQDIADAIRRAVLPTLI